MRATIFVLLSLVSINVFAKCESLVGVYRCECAPEAKGSLCRSELKITQVDESLFLEGGMFVVEDSKPFPVDNSSHSTSSPASHFVGAADSAKAKCKSESILYNLDRGGYIGDARLGMRMDRELTDIQIRSNSVGVTINEKHTSEMTARMKLIMKIAGEGNKIEEAQKDIEKHNYTSEYNCVRTGL